MPICFCFKNIVIIQVIYFFILNLIVFKVILKVYLKDFFKKFGYKRFFIFILPLIFYHSYHTIATKNKNYLKILKNFHNRFISGTYLNL